MQKCCAYVMIVAMLLLLISGCGLGDWRFDLYHGYAITRINSRSINLIYYETPDGPGSFVIERFFVTDFCMNQRLIAVKGIPTEDVFASEKELARKERWFYLVDTECAAVYGPYSDLGDFEAQCESVAAGDLGIWRSTAGLADARKTGE